MLRGFVNYCGKNILTFNNQRVVCPPGKIPSHKGKSVVVASVMRSGTHLCIDFLLNNFNELATYPLYVDVDRLFDSEKEINRYSSGEILIGKCIVKTHYPQIPEGGRGIAMDKLAKNSIVLLLKRDITSTYRSTKSWGLYPALEKKDDYRDSILRFYDFWHSGGYTLIDVNFEDFFCKDSLELLTNKFADISKMKKNKNMILPTNNKSIMALVLTKVTTRILGKYAPIKNTGIHSGLTKK